MPTVFGFLFGAGVATVFVAISGADIAIGIAEVVAVVGGHFTKAFGGAADQPVYRQRAEKFCAGRRNARLMRKSVDKRRNNAYNHSKMSQNVRLISIGGYYCE